MHHENSLIHTTGGGQYVMGDEKYQKWYTIDALGAIFAVFNNSNTFHDFNNTPRSQESQKILDLKKIIDLKIILGS